MRQSIGQRVHDARLAARMTQWELADKLRDINPDLKTSQTTIQSIESGHSQKPHIVYELAQALGVEERWLRLGIGQRERSAHGQIVAEPAPQPIQTPKRTFDLDALNAIFDTVELSYRQIAQLDQRSARLTRKAVQSAVLSWLDRGQFPQPEQMERDLSSVVIQKLLAETRQEDRSAKAGP